MPTSKKNSTPKKRVRDVVLPSKKSPTLPTSSKVPRFHTRSNSVGIYDQTHSSGWLFIRSLLWLVGIISAVLLLGALLFARAHVNLVPHIVQGNVEELLVLGSAPASDVDVVYETLALERTLSRRITVDDFEIETTSASGTIVIFNEENTAQRLREETRFETPEGLIFKLPKGPGITVPAARNGIPGSVEATVYAEEAGDSYNVAPTDFTIPGWREIEDDRFQTQYARSKEPMTGGGIAQVPQIEQQTLDTIEQEMRATLREQMIAQAWVDIPDTFVFFEDSIAIDFQSLDFALEEQTNPLATIGGQALLSGTLQALLIPRADLANHLATLLSADYQGQSIDIINPHSFSSEISPQGQRILGWLAATPVGDDEVQEEVMTTNEQEAVVRMRLAGEAQLQMNINTEELVNDIATTPLRQLNNQLAQYSQIAKASVSTKPFWRRKLPKKSRITVTIESPFR